MYKFLHVSFQDYRIRIYFDPCFSSVSCFTSYMNYVRTRDLAHCNIILDKIDRKRHGSRAAAFVYKKCIRTSNKG